MIFVCLGNPEKRYEKTRHNFGRLFGLFLINQLTGSRVKRSKFGEIFELGNSWKVIFLNCFMNKSGACLLKLLPKPRLFLSETRNPARLASQPACRAERGGQGESVADRQKPKTKLFVVHDDLDLPFGEFKVQFGRGAAGHHGVESVIEALGTKDFWRIRLGIGKPEQNIPEERYVLMPFAEDEEEKMPKIFSQVLLNLTEKLYLLQV